MGDDESKTQCYSESMKRDDSHSSSDGQEGIGVGIFLLMRSRQAIRMGKVLLTE